MVYVVRTQATVVFYPPSVLSIIVVTYLLFVIPSPSFPVVLHLLNNIIAKHVMHPNPPPIDVSDVIGMT